ncbi:MFS transporter [Burkholderia glumae]|uniref:MFS transporter n=1 Tax=Burkholderia glumae TaxID=337 RepID=UPI001F426A47|nr:MFS transporter [Burkholderia glumae]
MNFWSVGAILAALVTLLLINRLPADVGWRAAFGFGAVVAVAAAFARRYIPESPRWLSAHGETGAASAIIDDIEQGQFSRPRSTGAHDVSSGPVVRRNFWSQSCELIRDIRARRTRMCAGFFRGRRLLRTVRVPRAVHPARGSRGGHVRSLVLSDRNVGALVGGLVVAVLLDSAGRKLTVPVAYLLRRSACC